MQPAWWQQTAVSSAERLAVSQVFAEAKYSPEVAVGFALKRFARLELVMQRRAACWQTEPDVAAVGQESCSALRRQPDAGPQWRRSDLESSW